MRSAAREAARAAGVEGIARVGGVSVSALLPRLQTGDIAVVDVADLDGATAETLADAGVVAVLNAGRLIAGPYANLGPRVLADAGVPWIDQVTGALTRIGDGARVRVHDGKVHPATGGRDQNKEVLVKGVALGAAAKAVPAAAPPRAARATPATPAGAPGPRPRARPTPSEPAPTRPSASATLPQLATMVSGRPALLVGRGRHADLRPVRRFVRQRGPVVVALGAAADDLVGLSWVPDVLVVSGDDPAGLPAPEVVALAKDLVVVGRQDVEAPAGVQVHRVEPTGSLEEIALDLLDQQGAAIVVGINLSPGTRLPPDRTGSQAAPGSWLVDAWSLPLLASGRAGPSRVATLITGVVALGVGLALGIGPLAPDVDGGSPTTTVDSTATDAALSRAETTNRYAQKLLASAAPRLYAGGLTGHGIVVISMPGTSGASVKALVAQVAAAGGSATRTITLRHRLLDPAQRSQVDSVGSQLLTQLADPRLDPGATTYQRMGQLLSVATTTTLPLSAVADPVAAAIRQSLTSAGLVDFPNDVRLAPLVLVVLPTESAASTASASAASGGSSAAPTTTAEEADAVAGLIGGLATAATGVVVAGDTTSADTGLLKALRKEQVAGPISTVDGIDQPLGQVTAVLALEAVLAGTAGSYGESGADGPVPIT